MRLTKSIILILSGLLIASICYSQSVALNPTQLTEDVSVLRKALEKNHPGLYWYTSKDEFNGTWDSLAAQLDKPVSDIQFLKVVLPVVAKVKCAHTLFFPSEDILTRGKRFPLDLRFINKHAYIISDSLNQYQIPDGSELLSINGRSINEIVDVLLPALMAQGGNLGWKYATLENDFQNYYYYMIEQVEDFETGYIDRVTGQKMVRKIGGSTEDFRMRHWKNWYPKESGAPLSIKYFTNPNVALITIRSFSKGRYKQYHQDFDKLIAQYFGEIHDEQIQNLIIDLRGNEGGNNSEKVYSYLASQNDKPIDGSGKIERAKNTFAGKVIVLTNKRTISAQEAFVALVKNNNRGLTVGQSTPGSYDGLCGGNKQRVILPNSKFEIRIPLHASPWTYADASNYRKGEGFAPDIKVDDDISDLLSGKDSALQIALDTFIMR